MILSHQKNSRFSAVAVKPIFIFTLLFSAVFFAPQIVRAAESPVRGAAWWGDQYQYVYFDCLDDVTGARLDTPGNLAPPGFSFHSLPCTDIIHHVTLNSDNNFSGDAWNETLGFISFSGNSTPPEDGYGFNSHCPSTCNSSNNCWACYSPTDQKVYGWAQVDSNGNWLKLNSATTTPVKLQGWDLANPVLPGHGVQPGDFVGDASSQLGWLSFNCESELGGLGNCAERDYKVYLSDLQIYLLSAPNWSYSEACDSGTALRAVLKWYTSSGLQAGYEIVVNDSPSFATTTGDYVCWSGVKMSSVATHYTVPAVDPYADPYCPSLDYATNYYWWIRLYYFEDGEYQPTPWYQYGTADNHNGLLDEQTAGDPDDNIQTFTTYNHEFPTPFFTWSPFNVLVGSSTDFTSVGSEFYSSGSPTLPQSCYGANCRYQWVTNDASALIGSTTGATTSITFFHVATTTVTLSVTDSDNYVCSLSTPLRINYGLPIWREVKAE